MNKKTGILDDLTGKKFGRLTVISRAESIKSPCGKSFTAWFCRCDCGNELTVRARALKSSNTKSCGCIYKESRRKKGEYFKHGLYNCRLHNIWKGMKSRCYYSKAPYFKNYGGRGITVCDEWKDDFKAFYDWAMANGYRDDLTIDRIDNNKGYFPENCRWASYKKQNNNRRSNHLLTLNGETHSISEWTQITGLTTNTILARLRRGWSIDKTLETILQNNKP